MVDARKVADQPGVVAGFDDHRLGAGAARQAPRHEQRTAGRGDGKALPAAPGDAVVAETQLDHAVVADAERSHDHDVVRTHDGRQRDHPGRGAGGDDVERAGAFGGDQHGAGQGYDEQDQHGRLFHGSGAATGVGVAADVALAAVTGAGEAAGATAASGPAVAGTGVNSPFLSTRRPQAKAAFQ